MSAVPTLHLLPRTHPSLPLCSQGTLDQWETAGREGQSLAWEFRTGVTCHSLARGLREGYFALVFPQGKMNGLGKCPLRS